MFVKQKTYIDLLKEYDNKIKFKVSENIEGGFTITHNKFIEIYDIEKYTIDEIKELFEVHKKQIDWFKNINSELLNRVYKNEKGKLSILHKYFELEKKILNRQSIVPTQNIEIIPSSKSNSNNLVFNEILKKLEKFEEKNKFTEKGLTLNKLAKNFNTNSTYLSLVISENRNLNFNKYLSELRINYITQKLYNDREYLKYTVETLAEKCGMASRQNFSDLFQEINGIRPTDFVKQRKKEMEEKEREQGGISRVISES